MPCKSFNQLDKLSNKIFVSLLQLKVKHSVIGSPLPQSVSFVLRRESPAFHKNYLPVATAASFFSPYIAVTRKNGEAFKRQGGSSVSSCNFFQPVKYTRENRKKSSDQKSVLMQEIEKLIPASEANRITQFR